MDESTNNERPSIFHETELAPALHPRLCYFVKKECLPNWQINEQEILFYDLLFVLKGSADYIINGRPRTVEEGDILFLAPGSIRSATTRGMTCVSLDFLLNDDESLDLPEVTATEGLGDFLSLFTELDFEWLQKRPGYQMKCQALFSLILHKVVYENREAPLNAHVEIIKRHILQNYDKKITISSLARRAKLHPAYCGSLFKKTEGTGISDFINHVRINKAASLLETGEYTVGEVSDKTGFSDIYYFSKTFKKMTGLSPNSYKNKALISSGGADLI